MYFPFDEFPKINSWIGRGKNRKLDPQIRIKACCRSKFLQTSSYRWVTSTTENVSIRGHKYFGKELLKHVNELIKRRFWRLGKLKNQRNKLVSYQIFGIISRFFYAYFKYFYYSLRRFLISFKTVFLTNHRSINEACLCSSIQPNVKSSLFFVKTWNIVFGTSFPIYFTSDLSEKCHHLSKVSKRIFCEECNLEFTGECVVVFLSPKAQANNLPLFFILLHVFFFFFFQTSSWITSLLKSRILMLSWRYFLLYKHYRQLFFKIAAKGSETVL